MHNQNTILIHHGIKGQRWGVRRYQNEDGSLTPAGEKRYFKSNGELTKHGVKLKRELDSKTTDSKRSFSNRSPLLKKMYDEDINSKERSDYKDLINRRGIRIDHGNGTHEYRISYMHDDWSNPEKVMDEMIKDMEIESAYTKKLQSIGQKYYDDYLGAALKDIGLNDTRSSRDLLKRLKVLDMSHPNINADI